MAKRKVVRRSVCPPRTRRVNRARDAYGRAVVALLEAERRLNLLLWVKPACTPDGQPLSEAQWRRDQAIAARRVQIEREAFRKAYAELERTIDPGRRPPGMEKYPGPVRHPKKEQK